MFLEELQCLSTNIVEWVYVMNKLTRMSQILEISWTSHALQGMLRKPKRASMSSSLVWTLCGGTLSISSDRKVARQLKKKNSPMGIHTTSVVDDYWFQVHCDLHIYMMYVAISVASKSTKIDFYLQTPPSFNVKTGLIVKAYQRPGMPASWSTISSSFGHLPSSLHFNTHQPFPTPVLPKGFK